MLSLGTSYRNLPLTSFPTAGILKGARAPLSALLGTFLAGEKYPRGAGTEGPYQTRWGPEAPSHPAAYIIVPS